MIYWNGETALCNYDWNGYIHDMNVNTSSINEIWNSKEYQEIRKMHHNNNFANDIICKDCNHWKIDYTPEGFLGKMYK